MSFVVIPTTRQIKIHVGGTVGRLGFSSIMWHAMTELVVDTIATCAAAWY